MSIWSKSISNCAVIGRLNENRQLLWIDPQVLRQVNRNRQLTPWATEAGGQLFGTINSDQVSVVEISGPYAGDERSRFRYRSNPSAAQLAIEASHKRGLLYLGEWHTHAEDNPSASSLDEDAMRRLFSSSQLNSDALLMMIVGRARGVAGLAVWSISTMTTRQWSLDLLPPSLTSR